MDQFQTTYRRLNPAQKQAVDLIEGPVLVVAGPGTGKTQLLTARIANILRTTDTNPENILCLTFTESGAQAMRERLSRLVGQSAYGVTISTYHAFGSDLLRRHSRYFGDRPDLQPIDDLGIDRTLRTILAELPYDNPLKNASVYLRDVRSTMSELKRALLKPEDAVAIADANDAFTAFANQQLQTHLGGFTKMSKATIPIFQALAEATAAYEAPVIARVQSLHVEWQRSLLEALTTVAETGKTNSLTAWKNAWLAKDTTGNLVAGGAMQSQRLRAVAGIYAAYLASLSEQSLFDYDDMILRAIEGLETNPDLRYTLQEQYLYLLLDEFQDTNTSQLRIVELLTDSPVNEGRPNVLAVGDDDQAIYAFQGADYSNMIAFYKAYRDVQIIPLTENYRSAEAILRLSETMSAQISDRLQTYLPAIDKTLKASNDSIPPAIIERHEFKTDASQYAWVAAQIRLLIDKGTPASEIAVLAPQHKHLEPLVPHLRNAEVGVYYEKSENVLDEPLVQQLTRMAHLVIALADDERSLAASLWPEVLSYDFWELPTSLIWQLSWKANDEREDWTATLLATDETRHIALFFIRLSQLVSIENLETMLDYLVGTTPLLVKEEKLSSIASPLYDYTFGDVADKTTSQAFWTLLNSLTVLRAHLADYNRHIDGPLTLRDLVSFVDAHRAADIKILNTSPYRDNDDAVQLMTAFKSKGLEFEAVFILACQDEVWSESARGQSSNVTLPANLQFMRYGGADRNERLRLFYVALTRAKQQLYLTNYSDTYTGKKTNRLSFLAEYLDDGTVFSPQLPSGSQAVHRHDETSPAISTLTINWQQRHAHPERLDLRPLLEPRLNGYQLSPTHLNSFIDTEYGGPLKFFMNTILRFPQAGTPEGQFGNAIHESLEWLHNQSAALPAVDQLLRFFEQRLVSKRLPEATTRELKQRGVACLTAYYAQRSEQIAATESISEYNFRNEAVFIDEAHMGGKIDKLIIDKKAKTITIVDYKTGKSYERWQPLPKLHKYRQQLYLYRQLVERSQHFREYTVADAYLEFVEPDAQGVIQQLHLTFDEDEAARTNVLAQIVYNRIKALDFPDISGFSQDMAGITAFEDALLEDAI